MPQVQPPKQTNKKISVVTAVAQIAAVVVGSIPGSNFPMAQTWPKKEGDGSGTLLIGFLKGVHLPVYRVCLV